MRNPWIVTLALLLTLTAARGARAEDPAPPPWAASLDALRRQPDPAERQAGIAALLAQKPDVDTLLARLQQPPARQEDDKRGLFVWQREVPGAGRLSVFAHVPQAYTVAKAWPVLVWLHGAVSRDQDGGGHSGVEQLAELAEAHGFLVLSPSATGRCPWWSPAGAAHVRAALLALAATHRVDPTRVAVAGFSDGGSGCFHLLAHDPDPYGCFLSLMGNPSVTRLTGGPLFAGNLASRAVLALNGGVDPLYPAAQMKPIMDELTAAGARLTWEDLPEAGHDLVPVFERVETLTAFWQQHPRVALAPSVDWSTATPAVDGRRGWLEVVALDPAAPGSADAAARALAVPVAVRRPRLGVTVDQRHEGEGIRVERVEPGTPAADAGFQPGDVIVKVGETPLTQGGEAFQALRTYLESLGEADGSFALRRGSEALTVKARPRVLPQDEPPAELGYGKPAGRVVGEVKPGNRLELRSHGVSALRLHLARPLVDPTQPVVVVLNGKEVFRGVPPRDAAYVLAQAFASLPGDPLFEAAIDVRP